MAEKRILYPQIIPLPLDVARSDESFDMEGDYLGVFDGTDSAASVDIKLDSRGNSALTFKKGRKAKTGIHFRRLYISNTAQAGKILYLIVGGPESFEFDDIGAISISSITDPIFSNVLKGAETQNSQVSVGVASTLLRTVPVGAIEYIRLEYIGINNVFFAIGAAAVLNTSRLAADVPEYFFVSGGAAGLSINAIASVAAQNVSVLAVPVK